MSSHTLLHEAEMILDTSLANISVSNPNFGNSIQGKRNGRELEREFQITLTDMLNQESKKWTWVREARFDTSAFRNIGYMDIDIVGFHDEHDLAVAIELKYVTKEIDEQGQPQNPSDNYSFPYDVLKDCLKIESLMCSTNDCGKSFIGKRISTETHREAGENESGKAIRHGFVIGLTNHQTYWKVLKNSSTFAWALNYLNAIVEKEDSHVLSGPVETTSAKGGSIENSIWHQRTKRHHIILGLNWEKAWTDYSNNDGDLFRFIKLKPESGSMSDRSNWDDLNYIPFGSSEMHEKAEERVLIYMENKRKGTT